MNFMRELTERSGDMTYIEERRKDFEENKAKPNGAVVEDRVERMARKLCAAQGYDPDMLIQLTNPYFVNTPKGRGFMVSPDHAHPAWQAWIYQARAALEEAESK